MDAITIKPDGWTLPEGVEPSAMVKFRPAPDGRLEPVAVEVLEGAISARLVQSIPLGRLEAVANSTPVYDLILGSITNPAKLAGGGIRYQLDTRQAASMAGRWTVEQLIKELRKEVAAQPTRYGDSFYEKVAALYGWWASRSGSPAADLAGKLGVPVSTMWRWIRVCRDKAYLKPARAGKEG